MKTKEQVDDICCRINNQLETLRKYSGVEIHKSTNFTKLRNK